MFQSAVGIDWRTLSATTHEIFTRIRYDKSLDKALRGYDFVRTTPFQLMQFGPEDETSDRGLLEKYNDQKLSYHDALCAAVMMRLGIFKIFAFDADFWLLGFEVLPGLTR